MSKKYSLKSLLFFWIISMTLMAGFFITLWTKNLRISVAEGSIGNNPVIKEGDLVLHQTCVFAE